MAILGPSSLPFLGLLDVGVEVIAAETVPFAVTVGAATFRIRRKIVADTVAASVSIGDATFSEAGALGGGDPAPLMMLSSLLGPSSGVFVLPAEKVNVAVSVGAATFHKRLRFVCDTITVSADIAPTVNAYELNAEKVSFAVTVGDATLRVKWTPKAGAASVAGTIGVQHAAGAVVGLGSMALAGGAAAVNGAIARRHVHTLVGGVTARASAVSGGVLWPDLDLGQGGRYVSVAFRRANGQVVPSTSFNFAFWDEARPDLLSTPTEVGQGQIDADGNSLILLPNSGLGVGGVGYLLLSDTNGNPGTPWKQHSGPIRVL